MIRERRLYREELKNFNDYCNERWGMGRHQAYNLIRGSQVTINLLTAVNILHPCEIQPIHEKQVRPLRILELAQHCDVWEEAVRSADGKVVNYKQVKALVAELIGPGPSPPPQKKQEDPEPFSDCDNGVFREDAKQIVGLHAEKWYAEIPRWEVEIVSCESNQGTAPGA